jgi:hypothetical protein
VFAATVFISGVVQFISIMAIAANRMFRIDPSLKICHGRVCAA